MYDHPNRPHELWEFRAVQVCRITEDVCKGCRALLTKGQAHKSSCKRKSVAPPRSIATVVLGDDGFRQRTVW